MTTTTVNVTGMTCGNCVAHVTEAIEAIDGVTNVSIALNAGGTSAVTLESDVPLAAQDLRAAVDEAGYDVAAIG